MRKTISSRLQLRGSLATQILADQDKTAYGGYHFIDLGFVCKGVENDEGCSRIYMELGKEDKQSKRYTVLKIITKYYFGHQDSHHHADEEYWGWSGNLNDYIRPYILKARRNQ